MAIALVTGASSGLGEEFAWQLATARHDVVVVARSRDRLSETAHLLRSATGVDVEVLPADLTTEAGREAVAARLDDRARPVSLLVNNAGFGLGASFTATTWEEERALLDVHVAAPLRLTHAALPGMIARGHGAILNVSSIAARLSNGTYAAHKRWLVDFTHGLAGELDGTGVTATVVLPGLVRTGFHDPEPLAHMRREFPEPAWLDPEHVVAVALAAVRRGQTEVTPSARYALAGGLMRAMPSRLTRGRRSQRRG